MLDKFNKIKDLTNDVHRLNELRVSQSNTKNKKDGVAAVTPITIMNIRKGKKGRKVWHHNGLRVLLDSGSSHCIAY